MAGNMYFCTPIIIKRASMRSLLSVLIAVSIKAWERWLVNREGNDRGGHP